MPIKHLQKKGIGNGVKYLQFGDNIGSLWMATFYTFTKEVFFLSFFPDCNFRLHNQRVSMNLSSSSISIWTMTVPVIGLFSIIALNRASLSTIEWPQKWPRQETEDVAQWNEIFFCRSVFNSQ